MEDFGIFLWPFGTFYVHLVHIFGGNLVYLMEMWYILW
jgi:hypothetical protein